MKIIIRSCIFSSLSLKENSQIFLKIFSSLQRSLEQNQLETFGENIKNNYKVLTISNLTKFDTGNYTCEVEDPHSGYTANTSYYVNVFGKEIICHIKVSLIFLHQAWIFFSIIFMTDANGAFLDFKILTDLTNHTQKTGYEKIQWMFNVTSYPPAVVYW